MPRWSVFLLLIASACAHHDFTPHEFNTYLSGGGSRMNFHGHSLFRTIHFELAGDSAVANRWMRQTGAGMSISYSDIHQARSWFGYRDGDPDDWVRGVSSFFFLRRHWREDFNIQPYAELGTGPMWSNRRVPAATSRLNMNSQAGFGAILFARSRMPLHIGYRFSHISNGGLMGRNPGIQVHQAVIGVRVKWLGSAASRR
jgi:hypothetical protein